MSSPVNLGLTRSPGRPVIPRHPIHQTNEAKKPPHFVARGDSWFAFKEAVALPPFQPANLAEAIQELGYSVDVLAANALTALEISADNNLANLRTELIYSRADALLLSGGGDDLFLEKVYPFAAAVSAFEWFLNPVAPGRLPINQERFDRFLGDYHREAISRIASRCQWRLRRGC